VWPQQAVIYDIYDTAVWPQSCRPGPKLRLTRTHFPFGRYVSARPSIALLWSLPLSMDQLPCHRVVKSSLHCQSRAHWCTPARAVHMPFERRLLELSRDYYRVAVRHRRDRG
jgi:hypothetical protein